MLAGSALLYQHNSGQSCLLINSIGFLIDQISQWKAGQTCMLPEKSEFKSGMKQFLEIFNICDILTAGSHFKGMSQVKLHLRAEYGKSLYTF